MKCAALSTAAPAASSSNRVSRLVSMPFGACLVTVATSAASPYILLLRHALNIKDATLYIGERHRSASHKGIEAHEKLQRIFQTK